MSITTRLNRLGLDRREIFQSSRRASNNNDTITKMINERIIDIILRDRLTIIDERF